MRTRISALLPSLGLRKSLLLEVIRPTFAVLLTVIVLAGCAASASTGTASTFTSAQRAQVVLIVRDALEKDPSILREAIVALQADNARITAIAARATIAGRHDELFSSSDPSVGNTQGHITIAEFFDPNCPYCRQLAPEMIRFLGKEHDVRLFYKVFPILGPASDLGSRALLAAQRQGAYEALRDSLMRDPRDITFATIRQSAQRLGLNWPRLRHDMDDDGIARKLAANKRLAQTLGIDGTPSFVIGGKIVAGADMAEIAEAVSSARRGGSLKEARIGTPSRFSTSPIR